MLWKFGYGEEVFERKWRCIGEVEEVLGGGRSVEEEVKEEGRSVQRGRESVREEEEVLNKWRKC